MSTSFAAGISPAAPPPARRLPSGYYVDHFLAVADGVAARYGFLLNAGEAAHIATLRQLSPPAVMLYARLVNRRGPCFRVGRLNYPEIGDPRPAITELTAAGLMASCEAFDDPASRAHIFACFTMSELRAALRENPPGRGLRRAAFDSWLARAPDCQIRLRELLAQNPVVRIPAADPWPFLRFLFFGELRDNLADFVTRALGHVVTESIAAPHLAPQFRTRGEADDSYRMARLYVAFRHLREAHPAAEVLAWWQDQAISRVALEAGHAWFDRLVDRLGRLLERDGLHDAALALYATSPTAPARERRVRLLLKAGRPAEAVALLDAMLANPCHGEEAYAARQLAARLTRAAPRSEARGVERESIALVLDYQDGAAEAAVLAHYRARGWQGAHTENWIWNALFGLLLWDIIYDPALGMFHSPLQLAPSDLYEKQFYTRRETLIEARLATLATREAAAIVRHHLAVKQGLASPFVAWHPSLATAMETMLRLLPPAGLAAAMRHLAQDVARHGRGLPDLFLWTETDYRFVEVKAENDSLAPHQYEWLMVLRRAGIAVEVERVRRPMLSDKLTGS